MIRGIGCNGHDITSTKVFNDQYATEACLFNRSVRADTRMGPEGTKLKQNPEPDLKSLYSMPTVKPLPTTKVNSYGNISHLRLRIYIKSNSNSN